ncbi:MAG: PAS domain S-box protein [Candidatus Freyarchaeum deiterrae]
MTKEKTEQRLKLDENLSSTLSRYPADLLQIAFNSFTDAVFILDAGDPQTILECNDTASAMFGYEKLEMLGKQAAFLHVNLEKYREFRSLLYKTVKENKLSLFFPEYHMKRKDGTIFATENTLSRLLNEEREQIGWVNVVRDISGKKNEALTGFAEIIPLFAEKAQDMIYRISVENGGFDYVNPASKEIIGYTPLELYTHPDLFYKSVHPEDLSKLQRFFEDLSEHRKSQLLELRYFNREGNLRVTEQINVPVYDGTGKLIAVEGILRDITERKRIEDALQASEEKFKNIFEESPIGIILFDSNIRLINANKACLNILGVSDVEKIKGLKLLKDPNIPLNLKKSILNDETVKSEAPYDFDKIRETKSYETSKTGIAFFYITLTPIMKEKRLLGYLTQIQDITERKQMETTLQESELRYRTLFENLPVGVGLATMDGQALAYNDAMCQITGYRGTELEQINLAKIYKNPEERKLLLKRLQDNGFIRDFGVELKHKDNTTHYVNLTMSPLIMSDKNTILTVFDDITEHKRMEEQQNAHSSILKILVRSTNMDMGLDEAVEIIKSYTRCNSVGIRILNTQGNNYYEVYTGFTTESYNNISQLCIKKEKVTCVNMAEGDYDTNSFYTVNGSFYSNGMSKFRAEFCERKGERDPICSLSGYESVSVIPIRLVSRIIGFIYLADESENMVPLETIQFLESTASSVAMSAGKAMITAQLREAEEKLREYSEHLEELVADKTKELMEAQDRFIRAERLAAIGEFAAMVGHDLRNPLTGISGVSYILKRKLSPLKDERLIELLETIEKNVKYSNKIVTELLEYSKEIQLELTETTPKRLLNDTLTLINVPEYIKLLDFTTDQPKIMVDEQKMHRVFMNIIQNAIDAMPRGGELTIKSGEANGNMEISLTDTGIGIPKENIEKMFKPLFTTKAKGIGLGLSICKRVVEAHGGAISVKSQEGKGTTFTITLSMNQKNERGGKV